MSLPLSLLAAQEASDEFPQLAEAAQMRQELEAKPPQQRTREEYERTIEAYRAVSHSDGEEAEAAAAVSAAAGLLAEEGRLFRDERTLLNAVGQYELLRQRFPGSEYCTGALLHEGELYWRDLRDRTAAATAFSEFLRLYPSSQFASQVRADLRQVGGTPPPAARTGSAPARYGAGPAGMRTAPATAVARNEAKPAAEHSAHVVVEDGPDDDTGSGADAPAASALAGSPVPVAASPGRVALVTNVRHWSTPVYTRVAIDLQGQVKYEAARVPHPDRIYFDLQGTRVAPQLVGHSIRVTDDGFLQRIRVAQFSGNVTRVVLDVSQVSEYSAFFLPNPWRLIIDVHANRSPGNTALASAGENNGQSVPTGSEPAATSTAGASSIRDIAALGAQPGRVKATAAPTTAPIAASVPGTTPAVQPSPATRAASAAPTTLASLHSTRTVGAVPAPLRGDPDSAANAGAVAAPAGKVPGRTRNTPTSAAPLANGDPVPAREAEPFSDGQRTLVRALGLKIGRIVIDAGHGGHDSGTVGPEGIQEKDIVLDVSLRLGKLLKQRLGADVIYTRSTDTFIPLETRTAMANKAQADLFLSIHANSSPDPNARGVETYYLNFTTSPDAIDVAARENAVSNQSVYELSDLVKKITLKDKIDESREFAADVQNSLYTGLEGGNVGLKDRGVKKAPFVVLIGANMPSILAEISFVTNPHDAFAMRNPDYRERIAESLYAGVARYVHGLSGVRLAKAGQ